MQLQVPHHRDHPLSPRKALRLLTIPLQYLLSETLLPPATSPDVSTLIPPIMPPLDMLNQFLLIFQFQERHEPLPSPLAFGATALKGRELVWTFQSQEEEPLSAFSPLSSRLYRG